MIFPKRWEVLQQFKALKWGLEIYSHKSHNLISKTATFSTGLEGVKRIRCSGLEEMAVLIKKDGQSHGKHHLGVSEKVNDRKCCGREVTVSDSPLMALLNYHLCREITLYLVQNETHHGKHLPKLLQRLTFLFTGPKPSFQATATSPPPQINAPHAESHILNINPGHTRSSSTLVQSLPALAFTILQNWRSPSSFKMTL